MSFNIVQPEFGPTLNFQIGKAESEISADLISIDRNRGSREPDRDRVKRSYRTVLLGPFVSSGKEHSIQCLP